MSYFTVSLDDGYQCWLEVARILEKHGCRGTFNVCLRNAVAKRLTTRPKMFPPSNVITWDEIRYLQRDGHEIASHGTRHIDLSGATKEELSVEIASSKRVFESHGVTVDTYACQYNNYTIEADEMSTRYYKTIRGHTGINELPFKGRVYRALRGDLALKEVKKGRWIVGIWHTVTPENFEKTIFQLVKDGVIVKTVREMTGDAKG